ncbi:hypothetical protein A6P54_14420 [Bacillus sp. MKU004]|nr:hypothetical protein A6P54_14420 [Bacillus sp. MKU004]
MGRYVDAAGEGVLFWVSGCVSVAHKENSTSCLKNGESGSYFRKVARISEKWLVNLKSGLYF